MESLSFDSNIIFDDLNDFSGYLRESVSKICKFTYPNPKSTSNTSTPNWPISAIGQIKSKINGLDQGTFYGSGALVGPNQVLTCGHNLVNNNKEWTSEVYFRITKPNGEEQDIKGIQCFVHSEYKKSKVAKYDIGIIILDQDIGYELGWFGIFSSHQDSTDLFLRSSQSFTNGFSAESKEKSFDLTMYIKNNRITNLLEYIKVPTEVGQSGSPIFKLWPSNYPKDLINNSAPSAFIFGVHTQDGKGVEISFEIFDLLVSTIKSKHIYKDVSIEQNPYLRIREFIFKDSSQKAFLNQVEKESDLKVKESYYRKAFLCSKEFDFVAGEKYGNLLIELYNSTKDPCYISEAFNIFLNLTSFKSNKDLFDRAESKIKEIQGYYPFLTGDTKNFKPTVPTEPKKQTTKEDQPTTTAEIDKLLAIIVAENFDQAMAVDKIFTKYDASYKSQKTQSTVEGTIQIGDKSITIIIYFLSSSNDIKITAQNIFERNPSIVINVGKCAGNLEKVTLGDIIIAEKAFFYDGGKKTNEGRLNDNNSRENNFVSIVKNLMYSKTNWKSYPAIEKADDYEKCIILRVLYEIEEGNSKNYLEDFKADKEISSYKVLQGISENRINQILKRLEDQRVISFDDDCDQYKLCATEKKLIKDSLRKYRKYPLTNSNDDPQAFFGTFGCGNAIENSDVLVDGVALSKAFEECKKIDYQTIAIDRDTVDFYKIAEKYKSDYISIKSVSDYANSSADEKFYPFCSQISASYSLELIQSYFQMKRN